MKNDDFKFEEQINKLEQIVESLDEGELPLDELLAQYKEGMLIAKNCRQFLDSAQQEIIEINKDTEMVPDGGGSDEENSNGENSDKEKLWDNIDED